MILSPRSPQLLLIRADANRVIGAGHVLRCLALAQAWQSWGGVAALITAPDLPPKLVGRMEREQIELMYSEIPGDTAQSAEEFFQIASERKPAAVVIDGYHFSSEYQRQAANFPGNSLTIDDLADSSFLGTRIVLNQNLGFSLHNYTESDPSTRVLVGPAFALIRDEFRFNPERNRVRDGRVKNVLVTLGGGDNGQLNLKIANALIQLPNVDLRFRIIGETIAETQEQLETMAQRDPRLELVSHVDDMGTQYAWADFAVAAGGSSNWEMCLFGVPRLLLALAENQRPNVTGLVAAGAAISTTVTELDSPMALANMLNSLFANATELKAISERGRSLVRPDSTDQIATALMNSHACVVPASEIRLRYAQFADWRMLLNWRNDPVTRQFSKNSDSLDAAAHRKWLADSLQNGNRRILIAELGWQPVGTVRLDQNTSETVISWTVAPQSRGQGIGAKMVEAALKHCSGEVTAIIRRDNVASKKIAVNVGFREQETDGDWQKFVFLVPVNDPLNRRSTRATS